MALGHARPGLSATARKTKLNFKRKRQPLPLTMMPKCRSYGFQPGSDGYGQCRMNLDNQRAQMAAAAAPRVVVPFVLPQGPTYVPPRL